MPATLLENGVDTIVGEALASDPATVYVINPAAGTVRGLIPLLGRERSDTQIRLLGAESTLKAVMDDFVVASSAADLLRTDSLDLRMLPEATKHSLILSPKLAIVLVQIDGRVAGLSTDENRFVESLWELYDVRWANADRFPLRTPPLSEVRHTLAREIGDAVERDFDAVLGSLESLGANGRRLDEVTISLLVAARHDQLLYDISKWGEDVGIASKATFSRTKTDLEDAGLLETEKVPIDVGRPRLRLKLGNERLTRAEIDELAGVAVDMLW